MTKQASARAAAVAVAGLAAALFCMPVFAKTGSYEDPDQPGLTWTFEYEDERETANLIGFRGSCPESLVIPAIVEAENGGETTGWMVGSMAEGLFRNQTQLKSVIIPDVDDIGSSAFSGCSALESVTFLGHVPEGLDFQSVFANTPYLEMISAENANDLAQNAKEISGASGMVRGDNMLATPNEPGRENDETTFDPLRGYLGWLVGSKWYKWTAPASTTIWFDTNGSSFNTVLGAYEISWYDQTYDPAQAAWIFLGENGGFCGNTSLVSFKAIEGRTYYVCVGGNLKDGDSLARGNLALNWRTGAAVTLTLMTPNPKKAGLFATYMRIPVPKGKPVGVLPTPERDGYTFSGWYTKKTGGAKVTSATKFTSATTLYGRWKLNKYRVTLIAGEGCASVSGHGLRNYGSMVTISAAAKPGYKFFGWEISEWVPSAEAFTNYERLWRRNQTATVKMPAANVTYTATFVKEQDDFLSLVVGSDDAGNSMGTGPWYAEQMPSLMVPVFAYSQSYSTVTVTKPPAGATFKLVNDDFEYALAVPNTSKLAPGRHVVKVTAKNRWGITQSANLVVFGKNKTAANAWLTGIETAAANPYRMMVGIKPSLAGMNIIPVSGCAIAKMAGLPTGLAWDAKKRTFTGYPTKSGTYTVTITAARKVGKKITSKISTITVVVDPMPAGLAGTFNGHTRPYHLAEDGEYPEGYIPPAWEMFQLNKTSKPVTLTVASNGKLTAKVGTSAFSGGGLTAEAMASGNRYWAEFRKTTTTKVNKKLTRTRKERLLVTIDPFADRFGSAFDISESEYAYTETLGSARATISPDTRVFGRLNKFGKDANGRVKDADWSAIANLAAAGGEKTLYMWRHAADGGRYRFTSSPTENPGDATNEYVPVTAFVDGPNGPYSAQATLKVSVNAETGVATLAGASDDGKPINGTAVLSPEVENFSGVEQCSAYARFFAGKFVIEIKFPLLPGPASGVFAGVGDLSGQGWESGK